MAPFESWYETGEFVCPWKISGTFGSDDWASDPVEHADGPRGQSSWIPTSDGRKSVHRDLPVNMSSVPVHSEQMSNMTGELSLQDVVPLTGEWNDQILADVLHAPTPQPEVKSPDVIKLYEGVMRLQDVETTFVDRPPSIHTEKYVSNFAAPLLVTDDHSDEGVHMGQQNVKSEGANDFAPVSDWGPRRSITYHPNDTVLRNQENLFAAETNIPLDNNSIGQSLWSTPFSSLARDTGGSLPSARSVTYEGRQSETEVKMEQSSLGDVPTLIPDRNGNIQEIREAVSSPGGHDVPTGKITPPKVLPEQSRVNSRSRVFDTKSKFSRSIIFLEDNTGQSSRFPPQTGILTQQNSHIPFHNEDVVNGFSGRSVETVSCPLMAAGSAIQPEQLSLQPKEQMVGVQESVKSVPSGNSTTSPRFQESSHSKVVNGIGQGRVQQLQNSSWQHVIHGLEDDAAFKQQQLSLPQGPNVDIHRVGSDGSGAPPDWSSDEALAMYQLQAAMRQLDVGTRMCIRDALYRLAKSAKERRSCTAHDINQDLADQDQDLAMNSCITGEGPSDVSRCESETRTNHLDRSIASLLFNTGPFRKYGQVPSHKLRSVSQPAAGVQNVPWQWSSTGTMVNDWSCSSSNHVGSVGVANRIPLGNPQDSPWETPSLVNGFRTPNSFATHSRMDHDYRMRADNSGYPDNYRSLASRKADRLNMPFSSSTRSVVSANGALNFDRSAFPPTVLPVGMRPEGIARRQEQGVLLDAGQSFGSESMFVNTNHQSAFMPYKEDVGDHIAATACLPENFRVVSRFYDAEGDVESEFPLESSLSQFTCPDRYGLMSRDGGEMSGPDMNILTMSHSIDPSGKGGLGIEGR